METIEFRIKGKRVKAEATGFVGSACEAEIEIGTRALGKVETVENKEEYYRSVKTDTEQKTGY